MLQKAFQEFSTMIEFEYIDHIAYVFKTIDAGYDFFKSHPGFKLYNGPGINHTQCVEFLFVSVAQIGKIEILSPLASSSKSPISEQLRTSGPGFNHICYAVNDIFESIQSLLEDEWKVICNPVADVAFGRRKIAFLFHKDYGLIELLESTLAIDTNVNLPNTSDDEVFILENNDTYLSNPLIEPVNSEALDALPVKILELINNSVEGPDLQIIESFNEIDDWDSLSSAIFHASYESLVGLRLDPSNFQTLSSYLTHYAKQDMCR